MSQISSELVLDNSKSCYVDEQKYASNPTVQFKETIPAEDEEEVEDTKNFNKFTSFQRKFYLILASLSGLIAPMASTIYLPSLVLIKKEFNTTDTLVDLTVSTFILVIAIAPLFWGSASDMYGRRYIYIFSLLLFTAACVGCALSQSIEVFIVMRILQGIGSSAPMVVGIGTISDIFPRSDRGTALGAFFIGPLIGPVIGPILGGFLTKYVGWRPIFWLMTSISGIVLIFTILFFKETLPEYQKQPFPLRLQDGYKLKLCGKLFNPLKPLYYLVYPNVLLGCIHATLLFVAYYLTSVTQSRAMFMSYQLDPSSIGLTFLAVGLGNMFGVVITGKVSDWHLNRETKRLNGRAPPAEVRLDYLWLGMLAIILGLAINGWFIQYKLPLAGTLTGQFLIGAGMCNVFGGISTYLVDLYPTFSASITSVSNFVRLAGCAVIISLASLTVDSLGFGWAFTLFALIQIPGICILVLLKMDIKKLKVPMA